MFKKIIGLGSNQGDRRYYLNQALDRLARICELKKRSSIYETAALLPQGAPADWNRPYLNMAVEIQTSMEPHLFLDEVQNIENDLGRIRTQRWQPRPIDIDILIWEDESIWSPKLKVPHPQIYERAFVLDALKDIDISILNVARKHPNHSVEWMGIFNCSPDSFSGDGQTPKEDIFSQLVDKYVENSVAIFDMGAESTRPGANVLNANEEWGRLSPYMKYWRKKRAEKKLNPKLSIDTYKASTASHCIEWGADIINDVSGMSDPEMMTVLRNSDVQYVLTHSLSVPADPNIRIQEDPIVDIQVWLEKKLEALYKNNISLDRVYFDPGIGFGKNSVQSIKILNEISCFQNLPVKILVGHSRKSFLSEITPYSPGQRDLETLSISFELMKKGVDVLRVHDPFIHMRFTRARGYVAS